MNTTYLTIIDLLGTFSFAAAGSIAAMEKKLNPLRRFDHSEKWG